MLRNLFALAALVTMLVLSGCGEDCVECPKGDPILHLDKHKISLGATGSSSTLVISNKGEQTLSWTIAVSPSTSAAKPGLETAGGWLAVTPMSGEGDATITCTANRSKLSRLGISRAVLLIDAPDAKNTTRDSVEITIVKSDAWMTLDDGAFDSCASATIDDYYWVRQFALPSGVEDVIVDSISIHFCAGGDTIQLLAFDWAVVDDDPAREKFPGYLLCASLPDLPSATGWNTYPVNWYMAQDTFYLGYFQLGSSSPQVSIDTSPGNTDSTGCWTARDVNSSPSSDSVDLNWFREGISKTFAIRAHMIPAFQYLGKYQPSAVNEITEFLADGYRLKGVRMPRSCSVRAD